MSDQNEIIRPQQCRTELCQFLDIVNMIAPKNVLEIGTSRGGTLFLLCRCAAPNARIISVDLPGGRWGNGYAFYRIPLYHRFLIQQQTLHLIRANSHDSSTLQRIRELLGVEMLDLLFVDGDHSYAGVRKDHEMYAPLVRDGGIVAFHDILPIEGEPGVEVHVYWNEIKHAYEHREVISATTEPRFGIGVLHICQSSSQRANLVLD